MTPEAMAADAAGALAAGTNMTLVRSKGQKMPPKFPRGELLCENFDGSRCYSYSPLKVLAWLSAMGLVKVTATAAPNARLTAAAPDLLAALQALVAELDGPGKPYSSDSYAPPHFIETAKAAIAKATNGDSK